MKSLIFLLFIVFASSQLPKKGLIDRTRFCKGGIIQNGRCICPNNTVLFNTECKPCVGGSIKFGKCQYPKGNSIKGSYYKAKKVCSEGYIRLSNNTCIKKCPLNQIRVGNECKPCRPYERKIENSNICWPIPIRKYPPVLEKKPVIYLYPEETMDISVQLNLFLNNTGNQKVIKSVFSFSFNPKMFNFSSRNFSAFSSETINPSFVFCSL